MQTLLQSLNLRRLRQGVVAAREAMDRDRRASSPSDYRVSDLLRGDLLEALEAYTSGLLASGLPVPYQLRNDLHLNRALASIHR